VARAGPSEAFAAIGWQLLPFLGLDDRCGFDCASAIRLALGLSPRPCAQLPALPRRRSSRDPLLFLEVRFSSGPLAKLASAPIDVPGPYKGRVHIAPSVKETAAFPALRRSSSLLEALARAVIEEVPSAFARLGSSQFSTFAPFTSHVQRFRLPRQPALEPTATLKHWALVVPIPALFRFPASC